ncbi:MAG TPA: NAD-dependent epimerase/dehydratase family protein [Candidatus Acidoferrales bacterium]|nr:NAD-dependent epimerase/dehydratase family protein [Candidatus Acidoferrales bacterium]
MKIFVTGGNGFIGSAVVRDLVRIGHEVRCLLRPNSRTERINGQPFERVQGDVRDFESVRRGMDGCGATIHLAGLSSWDEIDSPALKDVVEGGTWNVLQAALALPAHRVVFVSSVTAVNGSDSPEVFNESSEFTLEDKQLRYALAKRNAELLCWRASAQGLAVVVVNPAEVYGPADTGLVTAGNLVDFARSNPILVCSGGTSIVHVEDVAAGIVAALCKGRPGERYILGGENLTIRQLASLCLELLGRQSKILALPKGVIRVATKAATSLGLPLPYNPRVIPYATRYWFVDNSKAQRDLGVRFRNARETLAPTISWLKGAGYVA